MEFEFYLVDSVCQSFLLIEEKKQKFLFLLCIFLESDATDVKTLQRLSGKCISFSLATPGTHPFLNEVYLAIGKGLRYGSSNLIPISGPLREELQQWLFSSLGLVVFLSAKRPIVKSSYAQKFVEIQPEEDRAQRSAKPHSECL